MKTHKAIRLMIVDDHAVVREGLCALFGRHSDLEVVGEAADGDEAVALFAKLRPDVSIIDLRLPHKNGVDAIRAIREIDPEANLVALTSFEGDADARNALAAGARGFVLKGAAGEEVIEAIHAVLEGREWVSRDTLALLRASTGSDPTRRELEVLHLVAMGLRNEEIATALDLSLSTVKAHVHAVLEKLDAQDRTEAVVTAIKRGLIHLP